MLSDDGWTLMPGQTVQSPICLWHTSLINLILFANEEQYTTANSGNQVKYFEEAYDERIPPNSSVSDGYPHWPMLRYTKILLMFEDNLH